MRSAAARLSGPEGLTEEHNTFARRHALAEIAGEFGHGASAGQLERSTRGYLDHRSVVPLGRVGEELRFTTRDLLACERTIVEGAERRGSERCGVLHPRLPDLVVGGLADPLNEEQAQAARALATDGHGVSVLQALAGTGKTRVLGALASIYETAGWRVFGVAPTGRAARELADTAGIAAFTIHRLLSELEQSGPLTPSTVVLFDEAGMAPTRRAAELFACAERAGAKVIVVGDSGQLPSVAAGGWFAAIPDALSGPELRQVMRQRDRAERAALEAVHDGDPEPYLEFKREQGTLAVHEREDDALAAILADWNAARRAHGLSQAVMIARDNATRAILNDRARHLLVREGAIAADSVTIADQEFRVGDRVIARHNDRYRDVDNGTLGCVDHIDHRAGALTVITDTGARRLLDAPYAAEHLDHAYALTGHGAHGATVEWAGVIGRPSEFTREWAYTSLSRTRECTRVYVITEATPVQREREQYAPPEPERTAAEALEIMTRATSRCEAECLALQQFAAPEVPTTDRFERPHTPLIEFAEAGADYAATRPPAEVDRGLERTPLSEPDWRKLRRQRERSFDREVRREL